MRGSITSSLFPSLPLYCLSHGNALIFRRDFFCAWPKTDSSIRQKFALLTSKANFHDFRIRRFPATIGINRSIFDVRSRRAVISTSAKNTVTDWRSRSFSGASRGSGGLHLRHLFKFRQSRVCMVPCAPAGLAVSKKIPSAVAITNSNAAGTAEYRHYRQNEERTVLPRRD